VSKGKSTALRLSNTLSKKIEELHPLEPGLVRMYSCGPTVYRYAHIGNFRTYLMADWIRRALESQGLQVIHVKNITDVGHMRQEILEQGEDKVIASAIAEGKTPQEISQFYTDAFHRDEAKLGILPATHYPKATDHIQEMIQVTRKLEEQGYAYEVQGNVYFSVSKFPDYGKLSGNIQKELLEGVRAEVDPLKRDPQDFTLWKAAEPGRVLKWPSPWGDGFPGWHIECSAMSTKYLGEQLDIHTGGVDNIFPHHEGELAQSEGAFGKTFVKMWVHGQHLLADGVKMSKSAANDYTLEDLEDKGFDAMAYRYLCLTVQYGSRLNFTFSALRAAQRGLQRLRNRVWEWSLEASPDASGSETEGWRQAFWERVNDDLDMPGALSLTWNMTRSDMPVKSRLGLLLEFDRILSLDLDSTIQQWSVPEHVIETEKRRATLRTQKDYSTADNLRKQLSDEGFILEDAVSGTRVRPKSTLEKRQERWKEFSSSKEISSLLHVPDRLDFSVGIVACNYISDVQRCISSILPLAEKHPLEILVVDNGSTDGTSAWLEDQAAQDHRMRVIHTDHVLGEAAAKNILLKQSLGTYMVLMDTSIEATEDFLTPLAQALSDESVGLAGPWGLRSRDLRHFDEIEEGQVDAIQAYCFAFRRAVLSEVDLMRESFRFYRNLDLEYSFCFLDMGYRIMAIGSLPLQRHEHRVWTSLADEERDNLSQNNFRRFLKRWGHRQELLVEPGGDHDHVEDHHHYTSG
jgi:cysteinyl-tRNA synthetase